MNFEFKKKDFRVEIYKPEPKEEYSEIFTSYKDWDLVYILKSIGFLEDFKAIVLKNNGEFISGKDIFDSFEDAEKTIAEVIDLLNGKDLNEAITTAINKVTLKSKTIKSSKETFYLVKTTLPFISDEDILEVLSY